MSDTGLPSIQSAGDSASKSETQLAVQDISVLPIEAPKRTPKGLRFWLVFLAICVSLFLSALELTAVASALPTIVHDLGGEDFVWVASAYALASTALLPASGGMAELFGRRLTMLLSLGLFALGSALCGAAQNLNWLIAARTIQGAGGGGIMSLSSIIVSDLVPLRERGLYNSIIGLTWACAAAIGPVVGGGLAADGQWRWLFYLNLPVSGVAGALVLAFCKLRTPPGTFREKMARMDWIGNFIIIASSTSCAIALTWGGIRFPWSSAHILVPLILGIAGIVTFLEYEATLAKHPIVPISLLSNRTTISGFIQTFINPLIMLSIIYYLAVYYQGCKGATPVRSGVMAFGLSMSLGPTLIVAGASIQATKAYRPQLWIGWALVVLCMGLMTTLHADTPTARGIGFPVILGVGSGIIYASTYFPVLAPLPVTENAHALAFFAFLRSFAGVWGVTIGGAILQTQLVKRLPAEFVAQFPGGVAVAYSAITVISDLPEPLQSQVREAFADSVIVIWQVMTGIAGIGLLSCVGMKALPLHTQVDERWGLDDDRENGDSSGNSPYELRSKEAK